MISRVLVVVFNELFGLVMELTDLILNAFSSRTKPAGLYSSGNLSDSEIKELDNFNNKEWQDLDKAFWAENFSSIHLLSPEAFCYFLPSLLTIVVEEQEYYLLAFDAVLSDLDRSPNYLYWNDYFKDRWTKFTPLELETIEHVILFLSNCSDFKPDHANTLERAYNTLVLLKKYSQK